MVVSPSFHVARKSNIQNLVVLAKMLIKVITHFRLAINWPTRWRLIGGFSALPISSSVWFFIKDKKRFALAMRFALAFSRGCGFIGCSYTPESRLAQALSQPLTKPLYFCQPICEYSYCGTRNRFAKHQISKSPYGADGSLSEWLEAKQ